MAKTHSLLSPSGADRWMLCPGSIEAEAGLPDEPNAASSEGTFAHEILLELCLPFGIEPHYYIGRKRTVDGFPQECDLTMAEHLLPIYDEIMALPGEHFYEVKVDLDYWLPGQSGTADVGILTKKFVMIRDLKYGAGVPVHPERNRQMMIYALGLCRELRKRGYTLPNKVILVIDQPRCPGGGGVWETDLDTLREFGKEVAAAGVRARQKNAERVAGPDQCKWCKAKGSCATLAEFSLKQAQLDFDDLDALDEDSFPKPKDLSPRVRAKIIKNQKLFEAWLKAVHFLTLQDALAGRPAGGLKAVAGRQGARKWDNEEAAKKAMESAGISPYTEPKLLSPAGAEDAVKKAIPARTKEGREKRAVVMAKVLERSVETPPKAVLVDESDPKPPVFSVDVEFDNLDETED